MLASIFLLLTLDSTAPAARPAPSYDRVMEWIDTVAGQDGGSFEYLNDGERATERRLYHERTFPYWTIQPTSYPSPYRRDDWC